MFRRRGLGMIGTAAVVGVAANRGAQRGKAEAEQDAAQAQQAQAQQAPPPPAEVDDAAEIQKYAAMKEQGLITEEEYTAKKKEILGI